MRLFNNFHFIRIFSLLVFFLGYFLVHSQNVKKDKEIVIIKKTIDQDGNEVIEKIVKSGDEAEDFDLDELELDLEGMMEDGNIEIDIKIEDKDGLFGERKIIIDGKEFNFENDFEWEGEMDIESLRQRFNDREFDFKFDRENNSFFHRDDIERKAFLGIMMSFDDNDAVVITDVYENSAAEEAGLKPGDIILSIGENEISGLEDVVEAVNSRKPGDEVEVTYSREGTRETTTAKLKGPDHEDLFKSFKFKTPPSRGSHHSFKFDEDLLAPKRPHIGVEIEEMEDGSGILITKVVDDSPAQKSGLQNGDIIEKLDGKETMDVDELIDNVRSKEIGSELKIEYRREGKKEAVTVKVEERKGSIFGKCYGPSMSGKDIDIRIKNLFEEDNTEVFGEALPRTENTLELDQLNVFPNPTERLLNVGFSTIVKGGPIEVKISDISGREVFSDKIGDFQGTYRNTINLEKNPSGIYVLSIIQNGKIWTEQIALNRN